MGSRKVSVSVISIVLSAFVINSASSQELLVATTTAIKKIDPKSDFSEKSVVTKNNGRLLGIAIHQKRKQLFWSDVSSAGLGIYKANLDGTKEERIISYQDMNPVGLAVDWVFDHLYWTDSNYIAVMMSNLDGTGQVTICTRGLIIPRGIAVDPKTQSLFIGDQGSHSVMRCDLDGSNCKVMVSLDVDMLFWPNQLTVDQDSKRVYWTDGWIPTVMSCALDGTDCRQDINNLTSILQFNPLFGISLAGADGVYFTAMNNQSVYNIRNGNVTVISQSMNGNAFFLLSTDPASQPYDITSHSCTVNKGGCSDICLPQSDGTAKCACGSGSGKLVKNKKCVVPTEFILFTDFHGGRVGMADPLLSGDETTIIKATSPIAVTYDPVEEDIYFSDARLQAIYKCKIDGSNLQQVLNSSHGIGQVEGLAFDSKQRRLYFSNPGYVEKIGVIQPWHTIEMVDLTGKNERYTVLTGVEKPRGLAIDSDARMLYYTDWGDKNSHVGRVRLDGIGRTELYKAENPNGLVIDGNKLYVVDSKAKSYGTATLYVSDLDGANQKIFDLKQTTAAAFSVTSKGSDLLVSGLNGGVSVYRSSDAVFQKRLAGSMYTNIFFTVRKQTISPESGICDENVCTDICVTSTNPEFARCLCPLNKLNYMEDDQQTCSVPDSYILFADIGGIKMIPQGQYKDRNVYTIIKSVCDQPYGLTRNDKNIFFSGLYGNTIYQASLQGTEVKPIIENFNYSIVCLSMDNNNNLFWTARYQNLSKGAIFQSDEGQANYLVIIDNLVSPNALAVNDRFVFWTQVDQLIYIFDRVTGQQRTVDVDPYYSMVYRGIDVNYFPLFLQSISDVIQNNYSSTNTGNGSVQSLDLADYTVLKTEKFAFFSDRRSIMKYDMLNQKTEVEATRLSYAGQMVSVGIPDNNRADKPGQCPTSLPSCTVNTCNNDYDCIGKQKCCTSANCAVCVDPAVNSYCNVGGYILQDRDVPQQAGCQICTCKGGVAKCNEVTCPDLGDCPADSRMTLKGSCCPSCLVIKSCTDKPTILNCPSDSVTLTLPEDSDTVTLNAYTFKNIQAESCSGQSLPLVLSKTRLQWSSDLQPIVLNATDREGTTQCTIQVQVKDETPPVITSCIEDKITLYGKSTQSSVMASWQPITATDNSGFEPIIRSSHENGGQFKIGVTKVEYIVQDGQGNVANPACSFDVQVEVEDSKCTNPPSLLNGNLDCANDIGILKCQVKNCNKDFILTNKNVLYSCDAKGQWVPLDFPESFTTSTCIRPEPYLLSTRVTFDFNCDNTALKSLQVLKDCVQYSRLIGNGLKISAVSAEMSAGTVKLSFSIQSLVPYETSQQVQNEKFQKVGEDMNNLKKSLKNFLSSDNIGRSCAVACTYMGMTEAPVTQDCPYGSVEQTTLGRKLCVDCPVGTQFKNSTSTDQSSVCSKCPPGQYQNSPGQDYCKNCPTGSNSPYGAIAAKQCVAQDSVIQSNTDSGSSFTLATVFGLLAVGVLLVIVVIVIFVLVNRRRNQYQPPKPGIVNQAFNPGLALDVEDYDHIPADQILSDDQLREQKMQACSINPYETAAQRDRESHGYGVLGSERHSNDYTTMGSTKKEGGDTGSLSGDKN